MVNFFTVGMTKNDGYKFILNFGLVKQSMLYYYYFILFICTCYEPIIVNNTVQNHNFSKHEIKTNQLNGHT